MEKESAFPSLLFGASLVVGGFFAWNWWKKRNAPRPVVRKEPIDATPVPGVLPTPLAPTPAIPWTGTPGSVGPFDSVVRSPSPTWFSANAILPVYVDSSLDSQVIGTIDQSHWVAYVPSTTSGDVETHNGMMLVYGWQQPVGTGPSYPIVGWVLASKLTRV
jgi:hypothetical protein